MGLFGPKDGWLTVQEADAEKHLLEVECLIEKGKVIELRKRHNDGEEVLVKDKLDDAHALPMDYKAFKKAFAKGEINLK